MPLKLLVLNDPAAPYLKHLSKLPDSTDIVVSERAEAFEKHAGDAEAVFVGMGCSGLFRSLWPSLRAVRWVHSFAAGVEGLLFPEFVASPVTCTNSRGVFAPSLGEFVLAAVLFFAKDVRRMLRQQALRLWEPFDVEEVRGKTMGIVGYGEIGRAAAARAKALGMRVIALRRRSPGGEKDPYADRVTSNKELHPILAESDYVVISAALTPETRGLIGARELAVMKPTAVLINVGRGPVVEEAALIDALRRGRIRGAALDVFVHEPLPSDHPFWSLENVLISPHCADHTTTWLDDAMELFIDNFRRFAAGAPLRNLVDKEAGY